MKLIVNVIFLSVFCNSLFASDTTVLRGKIICVDAGHGGTALTDLYRQGPTGEREEWINLRVAKLLQQKLQQQGATVIMTRISDDTIALEKRAQIAVENRADIFISIHHNATADSSVNFPIVFFHGAASENKASVVLGKSLITALQKTLYKQPAQAMVVSDYTIFPSKGANVLRNTYGIPGIIGEASFFTNPREEDRLRLEEHNQKEASAYVDALVNYFNQPKKEILPMQIMQQLPPFIVYEESGRMNIDARKWLTDYRNAIKLSKSKNSNKLKQAYLLFKRSASSFPDSYVAGECHRNISILAAKLGNKLESEQEKLRWKECYVQLKNGTTASFTK